MPTIIYGIKNCSTMKKAFDKLNELGVIHEFFDYKKQPISETKLQTWVNQLGKDVVLNKKGTTYRNLSDEQKQLANASDSSAIKLMADYPSLIKRPIIEFAKEGEVQYLVGFDAERYDDIFTK